MDDLKIKQYGDELYEAFVKFSPVRPLLEREPDITIEDAYKIQEHFVARRVAAGVYQPDFGMLTSGMVYQEGDTIDLGTMIQPKAEAELAFVLKADLKGPGC